jgi:DNA invertase Pin-like site-specific DNA recombinase
MFDVTIEVLPLTTAKRSPHTARRALCSIGWRREAGRNLRKERQLERIAKAKAAGIYKGRRPSVDVSQVRALKQKGIGPSAMAETLGIGRASVYRALNE